MYFGQALAVMHPLVFAKDLFFEYGSQASFTVFPALLAQALGVANAHQVASVGLLGSLIALVAVTAWAGAGLLGRRWGWLLGFAVLLLPAGYGGKTIFAYGEAFLTARSVAEPLVILGVGLIWRGRSSWALLPLVLAVLMHPLQALPGLILWWVNRVQAERRWLWLAAILVPVLVVAQWVPGLSDKVFARYDGQWWAWISDWSGHLSMRQWTLVNWCVIATDAYLLHLAWQRHDGKIKAAAAAGLVMLAIGLAASLVLADGLRLVLPTSLQLWRTHWLAHWMVVMLVPLLLHGLVAQHKWQDVRVVLFVAIVAFGMPVGKFVVALSALFTLPLALMWPRIEPRVSAPIKNGLVVALIFAVIASYVRFAMDVLRQPEGQELELFGTAELLLLHPVAAVSIAWLAWRVWSIGPQIARWGLTAVALLAAVYGVSQWDVRTTANQMLEASGPNGEQVAPQFLALLPPDAQIYWEGSVMLPWLGMRRASYLNGSQLAGALFNRGTAQEGKRREKMLIGIELANAVCGLQNMLNGDELQCTPRLATLAGACVESGGLLTHFVLQNRLLEAVVATWHVPKRLAQDKDTTYYLYRCTDLVMLQGQANQLSAAAPPKAP